MESIKLGMIGLGTVGTGVAECLNKRGSEYAARIGRPLELVKVAVRDPNKKRDAQIDQAKITADPYEVTGLDEVDIVIEVMGGEEPAFDLTLKAAANRKHIVTANKLLLALRGEEVYEAVEKGGVELGFEAAVAGAIPVIRSIKSAFAGDRIESIQGIVNGTGNYILSRMTDEGKPFAEILADAQKMGYAEADPTFDVEGIDSAHKIAILAALGFGTTVDFNGVHTEGISSITPEDLIMAGEFGYRVKLLAIAKRNGDSVDVRVHPAMLPKDHPVANVNGALNAVEVKCESAMANVLVGPGAGMGPTASAVMGDVVDIARKIAQGGAGKIPPLGMPSAARKQLQMRPMDDVRSEYYLRFTVPDRPGVLAKIAGVLGDNKISISSMIQRGRKENEPVSVVLMTHTAKEADLRNALNEIDKTDVRLAPTMVIRIAEDE